MTNHRGLRKKIVPAPGAGAAMLLLLLQIALPGASIQSDGSSVAAAQQRAQQPQSRDIVGGALAAAAAAFATTTHEQRNYRVTVNIDARDSITQVLSVDWEADSGGTRDRKNGSLNVYACESQRLDEQTCTQILEGSPIPPHKNSGGLVLRVFPKSYFGQRFSTEPGQKLVRSVVESDDDDDDDDEKLPASTHEVSSQLEALPSILTITMPRRFSHFDKHIKRHLPEAEPISAWDAVSSSFLATATEMDRLGISTSRDRIFYRRQQISHLHQNYSFSRRASVGQIGRIISHMDAWARVATASLEYSLILEDDDARVLPTFRRKNIRALVESLDRRGKWHVCFIYQTPRDVASNGLTTERAPPEAAIDEPSEKRLAFSWSMLAYIVSHEGAQRLLELARQEPMSGGIDDLVSMWNQRDLLRAFTATTLDYFETSR
jgi:GR25 family glycosyltransferase involved in LPS biosynthesis